jgi:hypothetical protein
MAASGGHAVVLPPLWTRGAAPGRARHPGRRRESVTFFVLVDGDPSYSHWHALINVGFEEEPEISYSPRELKRTVLRVFLSVVVIFMLLLSIFGRSK